MSAWSVFTESLGFGPNVVDEAKRSFDGAVEMRQQTFSYMSEGMAKMAELSIALEDRGWIKMDGFARDANGALSFQAIKAGAERARALATGNPIMRRAVQARHSYVFGEGVKITGLGRVAKNVKNRRNLLDEAAMERLDFNKAVDGNVFILVNDDDKTVEIIPLAEITGAIYNPNDRSEIWYFHRKWEEVKSDFDTGTEQTVERRMLYRNFEYAAPREIDTIVEYMRMEDGTEWPVYTPRSIRGVEIYQRGMIRHVASNRAEGSAWGIPDAIAGIFYATEHKELIEAADTIFRAQSQYAVTWKSKTKKALEQVAVSIAGPKPVDPLTGKEMQYGQQVGFGSDVEMQLMQKIGAGIDFEHFDPIANLASVSLGVPVDVVLGKEERSTTLPLTTRNHMRSQQRIWKDVLRDVFEILGKSGAKAFFPKIDPDPAFRQMQTIAGLAALKIWSPDKMAELGNEMLGKEEWEDTADDPSLWDDYAAKAPAAGSTEVDLEDEEDGPTTPGQGQTGKVGKLADGDHSLRDQGQQLHTQK